jgi:hypothetical protein
VACYSLRFWFLGSLWQIEENGCDFSLQVDWTGCRLLFLFVNFLKDLCTRTYHRTQTQTRANSPINSAQIAGRKLKANQISIIDHRNWSRLWKRRTPACEAENWHRRQTSSWIQCDATNDQELPRFGFRWGRDYRATVDEDEDELAGGADSMEISVTSCPATTEEFSSRRRNKAPHLSPHRRHEGTWRSQSRICTTDGLRGEGMGIFRGIDGRASRGDGFSMYSTFAQRPTAWHPRQPVGSFP